MGIRGEGHFKVFLGGTCNESKWREEIIEKLNIEYFNPVVEDWTPDCIEREEEEKILADYLLFVITPEMSGVYSIAEAVQASNVVPDKTVFCILESYDGKTFEKGQIRSLEQVGRIIADNGGRVFYNLDSTAKYLNKSREDYIKKSVGKIVRQYTGDLYMIDGVATHCDSEEDYVVYRALFGTCKDYISPISKFAGRCNQEELEYTNQLYRFEIYCPESMKKQRTFKFTDFKHKEIEECSLMEVK